MDSGVGQHWSRAHSHAEVQTGSGTPEVIDASVGNGALDPREKMDKGSPRRRGIRRDRMARGEVDTSVVRYVLQAEAVGACFDR